MPLAHGPAADDAGAKVEFSWEFSTSELISIGEANLVFDFDDGEVPEGAGAWGYVWAAPVRLALAVGDVNGDNVPDIVVGDGDGVNCTATPDYAPDGACALPTCPGSISVFVMNAGEFQGTKVTVAAHTAVQTTGVHLVDMARQLFAEHYFRSNALHCTATARILIPAECSAVS